MFTTLGNSVIYNTWPQGIKGHIMDNYSGCVQVENLDCIMAAVGGGGMISGISMAAKVMDSIVLKFASNVTLIVQSLYY